MLLKHGLAAAAILASGFIADTAHAIGTDTLKAAAAQRTGSASTIASRRRAYREPRVYRFRERSSDYYEHDASKLPFGTPRWRDQMRRENRLGNPGG
jgi:hypothetical protein